MSTYGQFCAVSRALDVLGERWTLLVVRELLSGEDRFNQIRRGLPGIPRSTLIARLRSLEVAGVIERGTDPDAPGGRYQLTEAGRSLGPVLAGLAAWAHTWDHGLRPEHLDPDALLWDIHRRLDPANAPTTRTLVEVRLTDRPLRDGRCYLLIEHGTAAVCTSDGGFPIDLSITATTDTIARWWLGELSWSAAVRSGALRVEGPPSLRRSFPTWFLGYAFPAPPEQPEQSESSRRPSRTTDMAPAGR